MSDMTTFGNNDSVYSHGEESISLLNRIAEITKEAYKYLPEKDCTVECGVFVEVDSRAFLHSIQHIRESIEAYRDLIEELDEDCENLRKELEDEREKSTQLEKRCSELVYYRDTLLQKLADEREKSTQLEQRIKVLTAERDLAKKLAEQKSEERIKLIKADRDRYFKYLSETHYFDTDIAHMYPKTLIRENNPCNFCGNCRHYAQMGKDDGDFEGICIQHYIKRVDPDDASCEHFKPTYDTRVVIDKPEFPVCEKCNHEDCSNCTLCPF